MSAERTRDVISRYLNAEPVDLSLLAEDVVFELFPTGHVFYGRGGVNVLRHYVKNIAFGNTTFAARLQYYTAEYAMICGDFRGKHVGNFEGLIAAGRCFTLPVCAIYDLAAGRITRGRIYFDMTLLRRQLTPGREQQ
jgi:ketosteroid isomerase-like protein